MSRRDEALGAARAAPLRVLFLCSRNRRRSPTAERVFAGRADLEVASAGLAADAEEVVTPEALAWADVILVMEASHLARLRRAFAAHIRHARVACLDIPDRYPFMDEALIARLKAMATPHLRRRSRQARPRNSSDDLLAGGVIS